MRLLSIFLPGGEHHHKEKENTRIPQGSHSAHCPAAQLKVEKNIRKLKQKPKSVDLLAGSYWQIQAFTRKTDWNYWTISPAPMKTVKWWKQGFSWWFKSG